MACYAKGRRYARAGRRTLQGACVLEIRVVYFARRSRGSRAALNPVRAFSVFDGIRYRCVNGDHTHAVMTQVGGLQGLRRRPRFLGRYSLSSLHSGFPHILTQSRALARAYGRGEQTAQRSLRRDQEEEVLDFGHRSDTALP